MYELSWKVKFMKKKKKKKKEYPVLENIVMIGIASTTPPHRGVAACSRVWPPPIRN